MSDEDEKTVIERLEQCEDGLTAIETILRCAFPQFFEPQGDSDNGNTQTTSGAQEGPGEVEKDASGEEKTGAEEEAGEET